MPAAELKRAFLLVWAVLGAVILGILAAPWLVTQEQISSVIPRCEYKVRYHRECILCGTTTAFFAISRGDFRGAEQSNRGSVPLYGAFVINELALLIYWRKRIVC